MARQEVKPTLKFGFQVYRLFVCEKSFQDFCVGPILVANYILISPQFKKIDSNEIYCKLLSLKAYNLNIVVKRLFLRIPL